MLIYELTWRLVWFEEWIHYYILTILQQLSTATISCHICAQPSNIPNKKRVQLKVMNCWPVSNTNHKRKNEVLGRLSLIEAVYWYFPKSNSVLLTYIVPAQYLAVNMNKVFWRWGCSCNSHMELFDCMECSLLLTNCWQTTSFPTNYKDRLVLFSYKVPQSKICTG